LFIINPSFAPKQEIFVTEAAFSMTKQKLFCSPGEVGNEGFCAYNEAGKLLSFILFNNARVKPKPSAL